MSREELEKIIRNILDDPTYEDCFTKDLGNGWYQIGRGFFVREAGLKKFNEVMKEVYKNESDNHSQ